MKKSKILFIVLMFLLVKAEDGDDGEDNEYDDNGSNNYYGLSSTPINFMFLGICEDEKSKSGACMYQRYNYDSKGHTRYSIFDKCGKGEKCGTIVNNMCSKDFSKKYRDIGESCNYDQDCTSRSCKNNKCYAAKENDRCDNGITCESGLYCSHSFDPYKCVKLAKEGEKAEKTECMYGLLEDKDNKCVKYGTIDDKSEIDCANDELMCKSSFKHPKKDDVSKCICDTIDTEPECKENGSNKEGKWGDGSPINYFYCYQNIDYSGTKHYYNDYTKVRTTLYGEFLKDYEKLDLDKVNSDGMKWKTQEKLYLFQYASHLKEAGIIDDNGEIVKDKKCLYEFIMKTCLHSNFLKLNTFIIAMIALLLF